MEDTKVRYTIKTITTTFFLLVAAFVLALTASANSGGFSVSPVMPENQNPQSSGYFDLNVSPDQQQELVINVTNTSDVEITVLMNLFPATTNRNGIVDYSSPGRGRIP